MVSLWIVGRCSTLNNGRGLATEGPSWWSQHMVIHLQSKGTRLKRSGRCCWLKICRRHFHEADSQSTATPAKLCFVDGGTTVLHSSLLSASIVFGNGGIPEFFHCLSYLAGADRNTWASARFRPVSYLQLRILHEILHQLRPVEGASFQTLEVFGKHLMQQHYTALVP